MKILLTTDSFKPMINGVVRSVMYLREQLKNQGHEVRILTLGDYPRSIYEKGVYYIRSADAGYIYPGARMTMSFSNDMMDDIFRWKPDIVHSHSEFTTWILARRVARKCRVPWVHTCHTLHEYYMDNCLKNGKMGRRLFRAGFHWQLSRNDCLITPTQKTAQAIKSRKIKTPTQVIPAGIDLGKFKEEHMEENVKFLKDKYGIREEDKVLLYVGRLSGEKKPDTLIARMPEILKAEPFTKLVFVGDGPYRKDLEYQANALGVEDHVIFTGMVPMDVVCDYYALGDVFVNASESGTQEVTNIEAMASGLPVVCKADESLKNVVVDGVNGFLFNDDESFVSSVLWVLQHPSLAVSMGQNARITSEEYSKERFGKEMEQLYMSFLQQDEKVVNTRQMTA